MHQEIARYYFIKGVEDAVIFFLGNLLPYVFSFEIKVIEKTIQENLNNIMYSRALIFESSLYDVIILHSQAIYIYAIEITAESETGKHSEHNI